MGGDELLAKTRRMGLFRLASQAKAIDSLSVWRTWSNVALSGWIQDIGSKGCRAGW